MELAVKRSNGTSLLATQFVQMQQQTVPGGMQQLERLLAAIKSKFFLQGYASYWSQL
jgi:hypothetical protein